MLNHSFNCYPFHFTLITSSNLQSTTPLQLWLQPFNVNVYYFYSRHEIKIGPTDSISYKYKCAWFIYRVILFLTLSPSSFITAEGVEKWLYKWAIEIIHSKNSFKNTDSFRNETSAWVIESFTQKHKNHYSMTSVKIFSIKL